MIDRIRRIDAGHLEIESTIDDPGTLTRPWPGRQTAALAPGEEIREFLCENNQYVVPAPVR